MKEIVKNIIDNAEKQSQLLFSQLSDISYFNQQKVLNSFRNNRISPRHFSPTTGYGYDDSGREALDRVFSEAFGAESTLVSPNMLSGTHTLTIALFGLLKPGDTLLSITGHPYDTLMSVIGGDNIGSLKDYGIFYDMIDVIDNDFNYVEIESYLHKNAPKVVFITRSRGYSWREAFSIKDIKKVIRFVKKLSPKSVVFVDNCYGEFTDTKEPTEVGADIMVGSLIKNPGGGMAPTGGYISGKANYIEEISYRMTAPSLGRLIGSYNASYLPFFQGFFLAPTVVEAALKSSVLAGFTLSNMGYEVSPNPDSLPRDIIRAIKFNDREKLISFIQGIQYSSPIDSQVTPIPGEMPGYINKVIMAAGTFVQGASIELSADSPVKEPYIAYMQGGLTYQHNKLALSESLERILLMPK